MPQPVPDTSLAPPRFPPPCGRKVLLLAGITTLLLAAGAGFLFRRQLGYVPPLRTGQFKDYNVLFVTLDTTRADHLGVYGYKGVKTTHLDAFARESFVFEDAISQVPLTLPSHASMMTGRLSIGHGVRDNSGFFLDPKETTLAEVFKRAGYATSAFVSAFVLDSRWQLNQGFDVYFDHFNLAPFQDISPQDIQRRGEETEMEVSHWLDENNRRKFFTWVHFYDPHEPYDPPEPYRTEYAAKPYDGEIAYTDHVFGKLMNKLNDLGLMDRTIIVVAGDHGEGLGEHGEATHAMFLYNSTLHVPLIIHVPDGGKGRVRGVVSLIDLAPTLIELAGLPPVKEGQGESLLPRMNGTEERSGRAFSESLYAEIHYGWSPLEAITTDDYKYIKAPRSELYDRETDRSETENVIAGKPFFAKNLDTELQDMLVRCAGKNLKGPQKMDPDTEEKLRALGYIGATAESTPESRQIDPKDKIDLAARIQVAFTALENHKFDLAMEQVRTVLRDEPKMVDAHFVAGVAAIGLNQLDTGIDELLKTVALRPNHTYAKYNLGYTYEIKGDLKQAEYWYLKVLEHEPNHLFSIIKLAHIYRQENQTDRARVYFLKAIAFYERALEAARDDKAKSALYSTVGELFFGAGDLSRAESNFQSAIVLTPGRDSLHYSLAQIYEARRDFPAAVEAYRQEIHVNPKDFKSYNNLGLIYRNMNRLDDAALCFQKVIDLDGQDPRGYWLLSETYRRMGREKDALLVLRMAQQRGIPID